MARRSARASAVSSRCCRIFALRPRPPWPTAPAFSYFAANRASLGDRPLAWDAVYALTLAGDRIAAGRRYYEQAALLTGVATFGADHGPAGDPVAPDARVDAPLDLDARAVAWNRRDIGALLRPLGSVGLRMSGVAGPLASIADVAAALARFAVRAEGLEVALGAVAVTPDATVVEWSGRVGLGAATRRLAMVEGIDARQWRLVFNTRGF
jgi:hypothetical protein